jgi:hypothetical protein
VRFREVANVVATPGEIAWTGGWTIEQWVTGSRKGVRFWLVEISVFSYH